MDFVGVDSPKPLFDDLTTLVVLRSPTGRVHENHLARREAPKRRFDIFVGVNDLERDLSQFGIRFELFNRANSIRVEGYKCGSPKTENTRIAHELRDRRRLAGAVGADNGGNGRGKFQKKFSMVGPAKLIPITQKKETIRDKTGCSFTLSIIL